MIVNTIRGYRSEKCKSFVTGSRTLDVGCSDGDFMSRFKGKDITGIDVDKARLEKAGRYGPVHHVSINEYFPRGRFDTIVCSDVIEHIDNDNGEQKKPVINEFMKKASGLLNGHGRLIISFPMKPFRTHPQFIGYIPEYRGFVLLHKSWMPVPIFFGNVDNEKIVPKIRKNPLLRVLLQVFGPFYVLACRLHGMIRHESVLLLYEKVEK